MTGKDEWDLVWSDEFEGECLDLSKWKLETGQHGWGNNEWQNYTDGENLLVSDGKLKITAKLIGAGQKPGDYTSTRLNSKQSFLYGRMEVRAKLPAHKGKGLWPAIWMLGDSIHSGGWPDCGEIDIMEYVSFQPGMIHCAIHSKAHNHCDKTQVDAHAPLLSAEEEFHIYGVEWTDTRISFFTDEPSNIKMTFDRPSDFNPQNWPFDKPHFFLMNIAVGGGWGGLHGVEDDKIFPATMEVDYVRVYQKKK
jgi:beta-glucanase (GH16 family)